MKYLSVCSGIEAATVAWHPLGWQPFAFAEIEKFPSAVLAHHYPSIPNLGDMTKFKDWPDADIDVLVGGTPCQSFSVAGLRKGMADPRGNLALTYLAIADRYRPEWIVWENVPGVLSSSEGRDFGAFIGGLAELGYHAAWRVLDAQYVRVDGFARAVPQRRRRVFVVGHLGDWRRAAAVLFERESLLWDTPPRRQAGKGFAADVVSSLVSSGRGVERAGETRGQDPVVAEVYPTLDTNFDRKWGSHQWVNNGFAVLEAGAAHSLRAEGFDASEDGTGRGTPIVPMVADTITATWERSKGAKAGNQVGLLNPIIVPPTAATLTRGAESSGKGGYAGRRQEDDHNLVAGVTIHGTDKTARTASYTDVAGALRARTPGAQENSSTTAVQTGYAVRRLTPRECERLQGFPDDYTAIPKAADGPRYKALGNSMAVNVMRWIGRRIELTSQLSSHHRQTQQGE